MHTAVAEVQQLLKCDRVAVYQIDPDLIDCHLAAEVAEPICDIVLGNSFPTIYWQPGAEASDRAWNKKAIAQVWFMRLVRAISVPIC